MQRKQDEDKRQDGITVPTDGDNTCVIKASAHPVSCSNGHTRVLYFFSYFLSPPPNFKDPKPTSCK